MSDITFRFVAIGQSDVRAAFKQSRDDAVELAAAIKKLDAAKAQSARVSNTRTSSGGINRDEQRQIKAVGDAAITSFRNDKKRLDREAKLSEASQTAIARQGTQERIRVAKQEFDSRLKARQDAFKKEQAISREASRSNLDIQRRENAASLTRERYAQERAKARKEAREQPGLFAGLGGSIKGAAIGGILTAGALGVGIAGAAGRDALRLRETSNRLSISARGAGQEAVDPKLLQAEFQRTAINTPGQTAAGVAEAVQAFVTKTGRLDVARSQQGVFATVASATGGNITDIGNAAADLFQKFDITKMEDMADALAALTFQGKNGAFELKDAASQFGRLSAAAAAFGLEKGARGVKTLGGLTQIARSATGSPEQAATAVEAMFRQLISNADMIEKKTGTKVFTDESRTKARDVQSVLAETIAGAKGDLPTLQKIFGDEGSRGIKPLIATFNEAQGAAKAGGVKDEAGQVAAGLAALKKALSDAIDAPGDYAELQKDAAQAQQDSSAKLTAAWERITSSVGDVLIPVFASLADKLADSPEAIAAFTGTIEILVDALLGFIGFIEAIVGKKIITPEARKKLALDEANKNQKELAKMPTAELIADLGSQIVKEKDPVMREVLRKQQSDLIKKRSTLSEADLAKEASLVAKRDMAMREVNTAAAIESEVNKPRSLAEFKDYYASLGEKEKDPQAEARRVATAANMASAVARSPFDYQGDKAMVAGGGSESFRENEQQAMARMAFARSQGENKVLGSATPTENGNGFQVIMDAAKLFAEAAKTISAQSNGSVIGKAP
jgi:hypothetical protein